MQKIYTKNQFNKNIQLKNVEIFYLPNNCGFLSEEVASFVTIDDSKNTIDGRNNGINPGTHYSVVSHDSIRGCVRPSVGRSLGRSVRPSETLSLGGQKRRRQTTYAVYPASLITLLLLFMMKASWLCLSRKLLLPLLKVKR